MKDQELEQQSVKVVDKRRFTTEGEPASSSFADEKVVNFEVNTNGEAKAGKDRPSDATASNATSEETAEVTFSSFIMGMATQVLCMLGEIPSPESSTIVVNLDAARQSIDILSVIQEKTKGNLTEEEDRFLSEVVPSLKMAYVHKVDEMKLRK